MTSSQFSLTWDAHKRNFVKGLSGLQQNGEFVDMTLAADGHFVKVHQVVMALASPYIKELITSAPCPHPVVFLNKISYNTLCAILEYIYMGEVLVSVENLSELMEAGNQLHIKGLDDMKFQHLLTTSEVHDTQDVFVKDTTNISDDICYFEVTKEDHEDDNSAHAQNYSDKDMPCFAEDTYEQEMLEEENVEAAPKLQDIPKTNVHTMQYTISNQGSLQMILNRYIYYLKHTNRDGTRKWRCVDYVSNIKCPAQLVTKGEIVLQRIAAHTHVFHDKKILKKVQSAAVFSALHVAEKEGQNKKNAIDAYHRDTSDAVVDDAENETVIDT